MNIPGPDVRVTAPYGLAILRIVLGIAMAMHGWAKLSGGPGNMTGFFGSLGIPVPSLAVWIVTLIEFVGGILLIIGALTPLAAILVALDMLGVILFAGLRRPFIDPEAGVISWELELLLLAAALCIFLAGPGAWSVDGAMRGSRDRAYGPA